MKPLPSLSLLLAASLSATGSLTAQDQANGKPVNPPAATPATGSTTTTVTEETNTRVVFPDTTLDKLDGKVARMDGEKKQLLLRTKNGKEPIPYSLNLTTKFLDLDGLPVNPALIIEEVPVEVRYVEKGTELIASTVVVQRY